MASNILGFTGTDGQGLGGVETYYDEELSGTEGRLISARNAWNTDMPFEYEQYVEAEDGHSLVLTIDETVQSILEKYLAEGLQTYMVQNGAVAVLMDVDTGAILGMATNPYYDPNDPFTVLDETLLDKVRADMEEDIEDELALAEASGDEDAIQELTIDEDAVYNQALNLQWRNKAVSDTYYPRLRVQDVRGRHGPGGGRGHPGQHLHLHRQHARGGRGGRYQLLEAGGPRPGDLRRRHLQLLQPLDDPHRPAPGGRYVL